MTFSHRPDHARPRAQRVRVASIHIHAKAWRLPCTISPMNSLLTPCFKEKTHVQTLFCLVQTLEGVRTHFFIPFVDLCCDKEWGNAWCNIGARGKFATRVLGDGQHSSDTIYHKTRGYNLVQHSHVSYHKRKPSEIGTLSTGFALP